MMMMMMMMIIIIIIIIIKCVTRRADIVVQRLITEKHKYENSHTRNSSQKKKKPGHKKKKKTTNRDKFSKNYNLATIPSFSGLFYDRSKSSSKASSPHIAIQSFLLQMRVSSPFLKVIQQFPTFSSSSSCHFYPPFYLSFNNSLQKAVSQ